MNQDISHCTLYFARGSKHRIREHMRACGIAFSNIWTRRLCILPCMFPSRSCCRVLLAGQGGGHKNSLLSGDRVCCYCTPKTLLTNHRHPDRTTQTSENHVSDRIL